MKKLFLFAVLALALTSCGDDKNDSPTNEITPTITPEVTPTPTITPEATPTPTITPEATPTYGPIANKYSFSTYEDFFNQWILFIDNTGVSNYNRNILDYNFTSIESKSYLIKGYCFDNKLHSENDLCDSFGALTAVISYYIHDSKYFVLTFASLPGDFSSDNLQYYSIYDTKAYSIRLGDVSSREIVHVDFYGFSPDERAIYIEEIYDAIKNSFN